jgi:endo-1,3-1,4-beta-glycanase ExoK
VYGIEWTPAEVRLTADGTTIHSWSSQIAKMNLPQKILLTIWASSAAGWAGPVESDTAPTSVDYDWVRVYDWVADPP